MQSKGINSGHKKAMKDLLEDELKTLIHLKYIKNFRLK